MECNKINRIVCLYCNKMKIDVYHLLYESIDFSFFFKSLALKFLCTLNQKYKKLFKTNYI